MLARRYCGKLERLDADEREEVRRAYFVWLRVGRLPEADIHYELLEDALRKLGAYVKANRLKVIEAGSLCRGDVLDRGPSDLAPPGRGVAGTVRKRLAYEVVRG